MRISLDRLRRPLADLWNCMHLDRNPLQAYRYLRGAAPEVVGHFRYRGLPFLARREDWPAIREVLVEDEYACIDQLLGKMDTPHVLDLGANIGSFALRVFARCPAARVVSLEPAPDTFGLLQENRLLNPARDWRVQCQAIWKTDGPLALMRRGLSVSHRAMEGMAGEPVSGISLPTLMQQLGWDSLDLVKMDIEGGEEAVIPAALDLLGKARAMVVEIHADRIDPAPLLAALDAAFAWRWQLNKRASAKPLYLLSHVPLEVPAAWSGET